MRPVQIAEALLGLDDAAALLASGRKCDEVPVRCALHGMFPAASDEELAAGLRLAVSVARLDQAERDARHRSI